MDFFYDEWISNWVWINPGTIILSHIIGAGLIVLHILLEKEKKDSNFLIRVLMILGVLSYGVYAWHAFSAIVLAYITYKLIEQPVQKWKKI